MDEVCGCHTSDADALVISGQKATLEVQQGLEMLSVWGFLFYHIP